MLNKNYDYFIKIQSELVKEHYGKFVVIANEAIVAFYDDYATAVHETEKTMKRGTFIVQECRPNDETALVFHSRVFFQ